MSHEMRFCEIADARNRAFCRTKRVSDDVWGSLSGGRVPDGLGYVRIMVGSALQWNCQFKHRFGKVFARSSFVICNSASQDRSGTACSGVVLATFLRVVLSNFATHRLQIAL